MALFSERLADFKSAVYRDNNQKHKDYMETSLLEIMKSLDMETVAKILSYYTEKLNTDSWKTEIGALNGFVVFIQQFLDSKWYKNQWIHFSLAVGLKLTAVLDDVWKSLGLTVFDVIFSKGVTGNTFTFSLQI